MYLNVAMSNKVQITQDKPPRIKASFIFFPPPVMAWNTYNGEVPISPKTIPVLIKIPAKVILLTIVTNYNFCSHLT